LIETRNKADHIIHVTERTIKDLGDKVTEEEKERINKAKEKLKGVLSSENIQEINSAIEELNNEVYKVSSRLYQAKSEEKKEEENKGEEDKKDQK